MPLMFLMLSCKNVNNPKNSPVEYINIQIVSDREYNKEERAKIKLAHKRFNESVITENGKYKVIVNSGDEIGIPNEFFYIFKMGVDDTNDLIEEAKMLGQEIELIEPNQD